MKRLFEQRLTKDLKHSTGQSILLHTVDCANSQIVLDTVNFTDDGFNVTGICTKPEVVLAYSQRLKGSLKGVIVNAKQGIDANRKIHTFQLSGKLKRLNLNPKRIHQIVGSYMVLTVLGAGIVLWFHQERSDLLAIQEQQTLQNEADQVVVSSQAYEMIMATDKKEITEEALKDILMKYLSGKALTITAMEETENKKGKSLSVEVTGNLRDYFTLVEELNGDSHELQIEPKQLNKQNNQLHIQFDIIS